MHRKATRRVLALFAGSACTLAIAGCKPDIPLIPFIKAGAHAAPSTMRASDPVFFDDSACLLIEDD